MALRDARAEKQRALLAAHAAPVVCLTMNIAGPVKVTRRIAEGFARAVRLISEQLDRHGVPILAHDQTEEPAGLTAYWAAADSALRLKKLLCTIEEADRYGRLLDIDIIDTDGQKIGREAVGLPPRRCLLCGKPASACARSRAHTVDALFAETEAILEKTLSAAYADQVASLATRALLYEVACTPKPGLVDREGCGAHNDMDFFTFMDSASVLTPYLRDCVHIGMCAKAPQETFAALRYPGMCAETEMLRTTGGVNTHKGAIFSLGILCGALGHRQAYGLAHDTDALCTLCADMTAETLSTEMHAIPGARGEAARGFPSARRIGLPALKARLAIGESLNDAGVYALVSLLATVEDANLRRRGTEKTARAVMESALTLLGDFSIEKARALSEQLTAAWLSPGGCADLLAVSYFLLFLERAVYDSSSR